MSPKAVWLGIGVVIVLAALLRAVYVRTGLSKEFCGTDEHVRKADDDDRTLSPDRRLSAHRKSEDSVANLTNTMGALLARLEEALSEAQYVNAARSRLEKVLGEVEKWGPRFDRALSEAESLGTLRSQLEKAVRDADTLNGLSPRFEKALSEVQSLAKQMAQVPAPAATTTAATPFVCRVPDDYGFFIPFERTFDMLLFQKIALFIDLCFDMTKHDLQFRIFYTGSIQEPHMRTEWWHLFKKLFIPELVDVTKDYQANPNKYLEQYNSLPTITPEAVSISPLFRALFIPKDESMKSLKPIGIPRDVHLIEYDEDITNRAYPLYKYIHLLSIVEVVKPDNIYVHCYNATCAGGKWWELAKRFVKVRSLPKTTGIYGIRMVNHAHLSDILRMTVIFNNGGIYFDGDTIAIKSLDPLLVPRSGHNFVSAWEGTNQGIGQSAFMAPKHDPFLGRWLELYRYYRDRCWTCHSVQLGGSLAVLFPSEITALPQETFLTPYGNAIDQIFGNKQYDFSPNYGMHLWCSGGGCGYLEKIKSGSDIAQFANTTYGRILHHIFGNSKHFKELLAMK